MLFSKKQEKKLGKTFAAGEFIVKQGEYADDLFFILEGEVEVLVQDQSVGVLSNSDMVSLAVLGKDEVFGEMGCVDQLPRSSSIRALRPTRVLTMDRARFLKSVQKDPSLALRILLSMSKRLRALNVEVVQLNAKMKKMKRAKKK
ncbi:Crp/Fnr family transcriptional regulator [Magnetococcales bacterium HHB-1]